LWLITVAKHCCSKCPGSKFCFDQLGSVQIQIPPFGFVDSNGAMGLDHHGSKQAKPLWVEINN